MEHSDSPLFAEWLSLAGAEIEQASPLCTEDALLIIDMQKDFVPAHPLRNPDGGRFSVAEGDHIVHGIVGLIQAAVAGGALCVATRDYHPHDHVSFQSEGGPFPEHCVQGTPGADFLPPIAAALSAAQQARPSSVHVAFKAFHEDADSFGTLPYANGGEGRLCLRAPGSFRSERLQEKATQAAREWVPLGGDGVGYYQDLPSPLGETAEERKRRRDRSYARRWRALDH